jgi:MFS family permease
MSSVKEPQLERQGRRLAKPGPTLLAIGLLGLIPGIILIVVGSQWVFALGLALLAVGSCPFVVGVALLLASVVPRWAARHRLFA